MKRVRPSKTALVLPSLLCAGLRQDDFEDIIGSLRADLEKDIGPYADRRASKRHAEWVEAAGGTVRGTVDTQAEVVEVDETREVVPLRLLKRSNLEQMEKLFALIRKTPDVVHWYLTEIIFPEFMRNQDTKITATGQAVGGDMLFSCRIGFSGTPSDLLPRELGKCGYERGSDASMISTLTSTSVCSHEVLPDVWDVESLLDRIKWASSTGVEFNALIDTGISPSL